ncbi:hypothetical protein [Klebsiella pneumoniae]|uniref:hypothetical protein n=1 Tax=Klebsiella pneumoniae TaxID=573 RepID=UPI000B40BE8D|nr:hypothetical protein [Klebsiella pneumoniae]MCD5777458.1 hypothetical protein [Klebsiella pneumoniae]OVX74663.1 hypothetical protein BME25_00080 [Klebsiella pneumoniae]
MNNSITRERLEEIVSDPMINQGSEFAMMARMALVALDTEPVAEVLSNRPGNDTSTIDVALPVGAQLYFHAQPEPVVPDAMEPTIEAIKRILPTSNPDEYAVCIGADMWNACRAAMLQAEPVCTCPSGDGSLRWPCPVHPGNSPSIGVDLASGQDRTVEVRYVAPPGYVMVPVEPNGDMLAAAQDAYGETDGDIASTLRAAMLAAAPQEGK